MRNRPAVAVLALALGLAACGGDDVEIASSTTTSAAPATTAPSTTASEIVDAAYEPLAAGMHPPDAGPASIVTLLLNRFPERADMEPLGLQPIAPQFEEFPLIAGCPPSLPVAQADRMAGRLSVDGQIFEVVVQASGSMWQSPADAQAAVDFIGTPDGLACEGEELEAGFDGQRDAVNGSPTLVSHEPSEPIDSPYPELEGARSFRKEITIEQFGSEFTQVLDTTFVARGAVVWVWTVALLPDIDVPQSIVDAGGAWLGGQTPMDLPARDESGDRAGARLLAGLRADVPRPGWFEPVSWPILAATRSDGTCSSYNQEPVAIADGTDSVAVSQVAASGIGEEVATFADAATAADELARFEATGLSCGLASIDLLLANGFSRSEETIERRTVGDIEVVVATIDLVQTVGAQPFDVRLISALGVDGADAAHIHFQGLTGDEPDVAQLIADRLTVLRDMG